MGSTASLRRDGRRVKFLALLMAALIATYFFVEKTLKARGMISFTDHSFLLLSDVLLNEIFVI